MNLADIQRTYHIDAAGAMRLQELLQAADEVATSYRKAAEINRNAWQAAEARATAAEQARETDKLEAERKYQALLVRWSNLHDSVLDMSAKLAAAEQERDQHAEQIAVLCEMHNRGQAKLAAAEQREAELRKALDAIHRVCDSGSNWRDAPARRLEIRVLARPALSSPPPPSRGDA